MTHYAVHHFPHEGKVFSVLCRHHLRHHFHQPDRSFGVGSPLWDYVFRTSNKKLTSREPGGTLRNIVLTPLFPVRIFHGSPTGKAAVRVDNLVEYNEPSSKYAPFRAILFWHGFGSMYSGIGNGERCLTHERFKKEMKR